MMPTRSRAARGTTGSPTAPRPTSSMATTATTGWQAMWERFADRRQRQRHLQLRSGHGRYRESGDRYVNEAANVDSDTLDFSAFATSVSVDITSTAGQTVHGGVLALTLATYNTGLENVIGGSGGNNITGNTRNNTLTGGDGGDSISGGDGDDFISSGNGDNWLYGEDGDDVISAGDGNNHIYGGDGADNLTAGTGDNTIEGEGGDNIIAAGGGANTSPCTANGFATARREKSVTIGRLQSPLVAEWGNLICRPDKFRDRDVVLGSAPRPRDHRRFRSSAIRWE